MKIFQMLVSGNWHIKVICNCSHKIVLFETVQIYIV